MTDADIHAEWDERAAIIEEGEKTTRQHAEYLAAKLTQTKHGRLPESVWLAMGR